MDERSGEEFREFMHGRWPSMVRLAYGLAGDQGHAEDVVSRGTSRRRDGGRQCTANGQNG